MNIQNEKDWSKFHDEQSLGQMNSATLRMMRLAFQAGVASGQKTKMCINHEHEPADYCIICAHGREDRD